MSRLTTDQKRVLWFMQLADGEGCVLAYDIAIKCRLTPRGMGQRMRGLEGKGLVKRVVVKKSPSSFSDNLYGWVLTDNGRGA